MKSKSRRYKEKTELVQSSFKAYHYEIFNICTLEELDYVWNLGENRAPLIEELSNRNSKGLSCSFFFEEVFQSPHKKLYLSTYFCWSVLVFKLKNI